MSSSFFSTIVISEISAHSIFFNKEYFIKTLILITFIIIYIFNTIILVNMLIFLNLFQKSTTYLQLCNLASIACNLGCKGSQKEGVCKVASAMIDGAESVFRLGASLSGMPAGGYLIFEGIQEMRKTVRDEAPLRSQIHCRRTAQGGFELYQRHPSLAQKALRTGKISLKVLRACAKVPLGYFLFDFQKMFLKRNWEFFCKAVVFPLLGEKVFK